MTCSPPISLDHFDRSEADFDLALEEVKEQLRDRGDDDLPKSRLWHAAVRRALRQESRHRVIELVARAHLRAWLNVGRAFRAAGSC